MLEQHPVPQNVTTFQFRLIGDMTIKQFAYLAGGAILAYISFSLPLPFFFRYPLVAIFALGGIGFAFVPIEERPMDVWFLSFIKSIYSPTQYIWQREEASAPTPSSPAPFSLSRIIPFKSPILATASPKVQPAPPISPSPHHTAPSTTSSPSPQPPTPHLSPAPYAEPTTPQHTQKAELPKPTPSQPPPPRQEEKETQATPSESEKLPSVEKQLTDALENNKKLQNELSEIKNLLLKAKQQQAPPASLPPEPPRNLPSQPRQVPPSLPQSPHMAQPTFKVISPEGAKNVGIPTFGNVPNMISGVIRERNGNLLIGILVTVKDKDDIPVRALKTNKLGQFAASTPLVSGTYLLEIEDPKHQFSFDQAKVVLNGNFLPPLEIIAKSKQELERAKLEHALFGKQQ